ncbi:MAG: DUF167 domain-containing protein [Parcubacteria group bacterium]|nr:DUF167 domain-containing protein [Parcubacteria group bacterium]
MYIRVKVKAGAKKEILKKKSETHFDIEVKERAERNMANRRVVEVVADHFGISRGKVRIISGHHSPTKILDIEK